ncbi:S-adenosyl-L-methionine-dependent methyltransferase [Trichoderma longibrachiatum ATCC 18648]|uniref:tRNA (uracil(54)-C(5))-methyltransferase n=1 Tax=Trichoderma longibrachiatum ATCC 18648 TaxID=983965 RepID=A0A2T4BQN9_TRILO|nr:S-adenosyl-L-methionine-dependent methyltransferase [Trichoderma longibrachiatum ATCC 18648]
MATVQTPAAAPAAPAASAPSTAPPQTSSNGANGNRPKRPNPNPNSSSNRNWKQKKTKREKNITEGSSEEVLRHDIEALLASRKSETSGEEATTTTTDAQEEATEEETLPAEGTETEVEVLELSSTGDGLAMRPGSDQVYVVPFTVPGDVARVKVFRHLRREKQTVADFVSVVKPSPLRDDARIQCKYFASCGGCQFQMLDYAEQLRRKRAIVDKAFRNFANLPAELVPAVLDTVGSPLQYGYRTKLTPHFDGPPGFRPHRQELQGVENLPPYTVRAESEFGIDIKTCETDSKATTHEYIRDHHFTNPAGSFFQNNNSILPIFTDYIKQHVLPPASPSSSSSSSSSSPSSEIKYLIDAYSGSGLFTITLASVFQHSTGIDIAADSIASARQNAALNGLGEDRCKFIAADAGQLFKSVEYNPDQTTVILDPPRKGCDADFLGQLRRFGPRRVVYVSCNVHTQARDVGVLVRGEGDGRRYEIESLRGFDFFPQTGHVEGVAVLNRVEE